MLQDILKIMAPGTALREGLDNILKARTGALIVIGDSKEVLDLTDGGITINEPYTPAKLYELAKMDGAIVISKDLKKILLANTQIIPSSAIHTDETGTRHKTAERTAKQTGELVISISQRRSVITVFKGDFRYTIEEPERIISIANQALQTLENYKKVFDTKLKILNEYEFNDIVTLDNVLTCLQRADMVMQIAEQVELAILELGKNGLLIKMQLEELIEDLPKEELLIIKDYKIPSKKLSAEKILETIRTKTKENTVIELNKIPRMPNTIVENLVKNFKSFQHILAADIEALDEVEGIGEVRAITIKQSLKRMQEQFMFDNLI